MTHEKSTPPNHEIILPDIKGYEDLYEGQEPLHLEFDTDSLAVMTAADMKRIEAEVANQAAAGIDPSEIQGYVNAQLEQLHMDPGMARDGVMAVRFVGVDGQYDIRAIDIDATGDFGVQILNAEIALIETQTGAQEVAESPESSMLPNEASEERDILLYKILFDEHQYLTRNLSERFANNAKLYSSRKHALDAVTKEIKSVTASLKRGEALSPDLVRRLVKNTVPEARSLVADDVDIAIDETAGAIGYKHNMEHAINYGIEYLSVDRSNEFKGVLEQAVSQAESLIGNCHSGQEVSEELRFMLDQLSRSLEDLAHSKYYGYANLTDQVFKLEQLIKSRDESSQRASAIFNELEKIFNREQ